jgi:hypothetical protein
MEICYDKLMKDMISATKNGMTISCLYFLENSPILHLSVMDMSPNRQSRGA